MNIFIVSKNGQPAHVTFCEVEAGEHFDQAAADGEILTTIADGGRDEHVQHQLSAP